MALAARTLPREPAPWRNKSKYRAQSQQHLELSPTLAWQTFASTGSLLKVGNAWSFHVFITASLFICLLDSKTSPPGTAIGRRCLISGHRAQPDQNSYRSANCITRGWVSKLV